MGSEHYTENESESESAKALPSDTPHPKTTSTPNMQFILSGPGIGSRSNLSSSVPPFDPTKKRHSESVSNLNLNIRRYSDEGEKNLKGHTRIGKVWSSVPGTRRPTFQGQGRMVQNRNNNQTSGSLGDVGNEKDGDEYRSTNDPTPVIHMYPRKEIHIPTSSSNLNIRSEHVKSYSDITNRVNSSSGHAKSLSEGMRETVISLRRDSMGVMRNSRGSLTPGGGSLPRHLNSKSKTKLSGSASMTALAAIGSLRASLVKRSQELQQQGVSSESSLAVSKRSQELQQQQISPYSSTDQPPESRHSNISPLPLPTPQNPSYLSYLLLTTRHSSSNFIHKISSSEIVYSTPHHTPKMIGPYLVGSMIGRGSFGKVKEGICSETLQRVAIKVLDKKRIRKMSGGIDAVVREIKLLRRLKHPNVIKLIHVYCKVCPVGEDETAVLVWYSMIEDDSVLWNGVDGRGEDKRVEVLKWYLVFEYCERDLQGVLEERGEVGRWRWYFTQLIEGLSYLHSQGVVHRDIKPPNLLLTPHPTLKITDFGIAEQFSTFDGRPMGVTSFAGTHQFLAPELLGDEEQEIDCDESDEDRDTPEGDGDCDTPIDGEKVDVWACGIVLWNLVSGGGFPFTTSPGGSKGSVESIKSKERSDEGLEGDSKKEYGESSSSKKKKNLPSSSSSYSSTSNDNNNDIPNSTTSLKSSTPAQSSNLLHLYTKILHQNLQIPPHFPPDLNTLLPSILDRNASTRLSASALRSRLFGWETKMNTGLLEKEQEKEGDSTKNKNINHFAVTCETTLMPYLHTLFAEEIERELDQGGSIEVEFDQNENQANTNKGKKWKWISHFLHRSRTRSRGNLGSKSRGGSRDELRAKEKGENKSAGVRVFKSREL